MTWPPDVFRELERRRVIINDLAENPELRALAMQHYAGSAQGCIDWINDFCVTYDPRRKGGDEPKLMPFTLFARQREFIEFLHGCYSDKENGLVEKCRDAGMTWCASAFSMWLWLFHGGTAGGWGSRKEEYVDRKGDPKAIFPKMRQILENLPVWMLPKGFNPRLHSSHMKLINPENGSSVAGEAGDNMGRGGRTTIYFKDESAHYEHPELIEAALGDNTDVQIDISSVNGTGNVFYRRRMAGEVWESGKVMGKGKTRVFIFEWRDHPGKTQEWYDQRRHKAEEEGLLHVFAQEVDRDYSGSIVGVIIPQIWVQAAIDAHIKLGFEPSGKIRGMQDVADGGADKNALTIMHGVVIIFSDHWGGEAGNAARHAIPICNEHGVSELYYDCIGVGSAFKTECNTMAKEPSWNKSLRVYPWDAGAAPIDPELPSIPGDANSPKNKDQYKNLKAQSWFRMRARFYKTYRAVIEGAKYKPEELISISSKIPRRHELCLELSQAVRKDNGEGKTIVDKKPDGTTSPNLADSAIGCANPSRPKGFFDV